MSNKLAIPGLFVIRDKKPLNLINLECNRLDGECFHRLHQREIPDQQFLPQDPLISLLPFADHVKYEIEMMTRSRFEPLIFDS